MMPLSRKIISFCLVIWAVLTIATACRTARHSKSKILTDLGGDNKLVSERFERYKSKRQHCSPVPAAQANYRVLLAGFGPFSGVEFNTSSVVAMNFADQFADTGNSLTKPSIGKNDADGIVRQDIVTISGKRVAVCAVAASVIWDLAAAIYLYESEIFRPDLIIMSGMDGGNETIGTWEHHATNVAKSVHGYESDGAESTVTPIESSHGGDPIILPGGPDKLSMTWDAQRLVDVTRPIVRKKFPDFDVQTSEMETPGKYLCNNVSYVVLAGIAGHRLRLAGGKMNIKVHGLSKTRAGFFHYPWNSKQDDAAVRAWSRVLAAAISSEMSRKF